MDELISSFEQLSLMKKVEIQGILSDQLKLKEEMQKNLMEIDERIKSIITYLQHNTFFNNNYFPLDNDDDLKYMEDKISKKMATDPQFESLLVDDLIFIGGKDAQDMVIRLMTKLFTMQLLSGYTLLGYGAKSRSFSNLNIYKIIIAAVIKQFNDTTEDNINKLIKDHLKTLKKPPRTSENL